MNKTVNLILSPQEAFDENLFNEVIRTKVRLPEGAGYHLSIKKRSIDARHREVVVHITGEIMDDEAFGKRIAYSRNLGDVSRKKEVLIVGAGPSGLFAALKLIESGFKPIILERGKDVQSRRRDLAAINKEHIVNPNSNYCFGEGGAGTYSDGKLYTRSTKRGDLRRILEILYVHGAMEEILYDAHPHIGTNKLPGIITAIRETIEKSGGEIHFNKQVCDLDIRSDQVYGLKTADGGEYSCDKIILATGHSARDIFLLLHEKKVYLEAKPFAIGVRVEHSQQLIDQLQYHCKIDRSPFLPAAAYSLVHQVKAGYRERGVFSFCMCPGGFIVPSATAPGEIVVNGMSPSRRDSKFANSGIVVAVDGRDFMEFEKYGPLAGMYYQSAVEHRANTTGGQHAPAQRLEDFIQRKISSTLPGTSYQPGLVSVDMDMVMPVEISECLRQGFIEFGKKMKGYRTNEAQVVGTESRTSSPVKIPRHKETLEHIHVKGLYPCGEGAGYAGGIVSAAMDGERVAEAIRLKG